MHALSLPTWWIHITSVLEWMVAMRAVQQLGRRRAEPAWNWLALAMLPALVSAMCACTWHLYDNSPSLYGLVVLQAGLTALGNLALALACLLLLRRQGTRAASDEASGDG
jgi:polyferredoxin